MAKSNCPTAGSEIRKIVPDTDADRLSNLPENVIHIILRNLPIVEAVRTSALSTFWRYQWSTLPQIVIDEGSVSLPKHLEGIMRDNHLEKIVDRILLLHQGPINYFKFSNYMETCHGMDEWILFLSRNGIRELIIEKWEGELYKLPSCLFQCVNLTVLELYRCTLVPPASFRGFSRLRVLNIEDVTLTDDCLRRLLSACQLLEELIVADLSCWPRIEISAPKLVYLEINSRVEDLHLKNTPCLRAASFTLETSDGSHAAKTEKCRIDSVLDNIPNIEKLELHDSTLKALSVGRIPARLPGVCLVKELLIHVNFEDLKEMQAAFCIFRSSPVMEKLEITANSDQLNARSLVDGFWGKEENFRCTFSHLCSVKVDGFSGITSELNFIKFIFAHAPVLGKLHIKFKKNTSDAEEVDDKNSDVEGNKKMQKILRELIRFCRISPKAELILPA